MSGGILADLNAHSLNNEIVLVDTTHGGIHWQVRGTLIEVSHHLGTGGQTTVVLEVSGGSPLVRLTLSSSESYEDGSAS